MTTTKPEAADFSGAQDLNRTIERAKQELERMIDLNPQVMLLADRRGTVLRANKALLGMVGLSDIRSVSGRKLDELFPCDAPQRFANLISEKGCRTEDIPVVLPVGRRRLLRFTSLVSGPDSELLAIVVDDVTDQVGQIQGVEKEYKKEVVRALMGGLMHILGQPLTVIMIRAQMLQYDLEKGNVPVENLKRGLKDITSLTMQVAETLKRLESPRDFVTESYMPGVQILDVERTGGEAGSVRELLLAAVEGLMSALDARAPGFLDHAKHTAGYAERIAVQMGMSPDEVRSIRRCAYLHDIGKVAIPTDILLKPGALTDGETAIMQRHSEAGHHFLSGFGFLHDEAATAFGHHEWFNGKGYPRAVPAGTLPLRVRIVAVADAYDALRTSRSYHPAAPSEKVAAEIRAGAGTQFDPEVIRVFDACAAEFGKMFAVQSDVIVS